ncbi:DUF2764 family protein [Tannerella sp.]|uniref:DUF2764 family protein n=1 Tax=Tannerella sp. TaxID=2382127 RepID=UPI0026DCCB59|nr:DUF2764 family protein [Tannerella sp.]MDO4703923.1 DUF2764 family protein [Tannerella sp.]
MSKYYYLIAGLPDIALDDGKRTYTVADFKHEVMPMLSAGDQKRFAYFFLQYDNRNVLSFLQKKEIPWDERGNIPYEAIEQLYQALREDEAPPRHTAVPAYIREFMKEYLVAMEKGETSEVPWEDRLSARYYQYAMEVKNDFMAQWFELNLNIGNILAALNCRKYDLDRKRFLVGENEVAEALRTSNARDFGLSETLDYLPELLRIAEETDLLMREKKIDLLKWNWLEEHTFFKTFDFESVFAYLLRIEMIERWTALDKVSGEQTFRRMVGAMKQESAGVLEEFKRNNTK